MLKKDLTVREHLKTIQSDGGKAGWAKRTPEERSAQARKIVGARWAKKKAAELVPETTSSASLQRVWQRNRLKTRSTALFISDFSCDESVYVDSERAPPGGDSRNAALWQACRSAPRRLDHQLAAEYALTEFNVKMVGVWDTVGALGIPGHLFSTFDQAKYGFLDTTLNPCVQKAYHAVSIDERRAQYRPTLWTDKGGNPRSNLELRPQFVALITNCNPYLYS